MALNPIMPFFSRVWTLVSTSLFSSLVYEVQSCIGVIVDFIKHIFLSCTWRPTKNVMVEFYTWSIFHPRGFGLFTIIPYKFFGRVYVPSLTIESHTHCHKFSHTCSSSIIVQSSTQNMINFGINWILTV